MKNQKQSEREKGIISNVPFSNSETEIYLSNNNAEFKGSTENNHSIDLPLKILKTNAGNKIIS